MTQKVLLVVPEAPVQQAAASTSRRKLGAGQALRLGTLDNSKSNADHLLAMLVDGVNYLDVAFIREGSIQEGHLGPITFGKIFDAAGKPVTTVAGKLRADMLDVDELRVGNGNIAGALESSARGANGRPRWRLDKEGGFEVNGPSGKGSLDIADGLLQARYPSGALLMRLGYWGDS